MATTYLELTDDKSGANKFYEVAQRGKAVAIRFGRIGTEGTSKTTNYATPSEAKAAAAKLLDAKERKGYASANAGSAPARKKPVLTGNAPILWKFKATMSALGVYVDDKRCWVGDEAGHVYALDHKQKVLAHYDLEDGVKAIVADEQWIYAGNDSGLVYDLSRKVPTVAYEIRGQSMVCWMEIYRGKLLVSDGNARCTAYDHEGDKLWEYKVKGKLGWMVRADDDGVYHGIGGWDSPGLVTKYDWSGKKRWQEKCKQGVGFGWQEDDKVYASTCGTNASWTQRSGGVHVFGKDGTVGPYCKADSGALSCATSPGGKYIFCADDSGFIYCFDAKGTRLWKLKTRVGSSQSMQFHKDRLYLVTDQGWLACVDVSEAAILRASKGKTPTAKAIKGTAKAAKVGDKLASGDGTRGVVVECKKEGSRLRVFAVSKGYDASWKVQFPRDLRVDGARFVVDELVEATQGGFYRAVGEIRRVSASKTTKKKAVKKKAVKKKAVKKKAVKKKPVAKKKAAKKKAKKR